MCQLANVIVGRDTIQLEVEVDPLFSDLNSSVRPLAIETHG